MPWIVVDGESRLGWLMTTMSVSGWMFLLVPAHPGCPGQIPQSCVCVCVCMSPSHDTTVYLFTDRQCDTPTSGLFTVHNDSAKYHILECGNLGVGSMAPTFQKTCLGYWWRLMPNFMPFDEVSAKKTVTWPKTISKLSIPSILHMEG